MGVGGWRGYAGKAMNIKRMTKKKKSLLFIFYFFCFCEFGVGEGREGQGKGREGQWVGAIIFYVMHCINLIHIALRFHEDIP